MSKFVLTGCLLILLASFLNYPTSPENAKGHQRQDLTVIFPISEQVKLARMEKNLSEKGAAFFGQKTKSLGGTIGRNCADLRKEYSTKIRSYFARLAPARVH